MLFNLLYILCLSIQFLSSIFCLSVVWIHWSSTEDFDDIDKHIESLIIVRDYRTRKYRIAWNLAIINTVLLLLFSVAYIITNNVLK